MSKKASWEGKSRGGALGYRIFLFFLKYVGLSSAYIILYIVAGWYLVFARKSTRASYFYFRQIHGFPPLKSLRYCYKSYYKFGQTLIDKVVILGGFPNKFTFFFDGVENLRQLSEDGRGALLISAHIGNWEIAGHLLKKLNTPVNVVLYDGEDQGIKEVLEGAIKNRQFKIISVKNDFSHLLDMHNALQNKEFICIHGDRYIKNSNQKTYRTTFMGRYASFPLGPFELAVRFKVPYTFVFSVKETDTHYHFFATPGHIAHDNPEKVIDAYLRSLEKILRQFPEQWFNYYDFWEDSSPALTTSAATIPTDI
jgi:predicted LPLAT superfamily acyltransferase